MGTRFIETEADAECIMEVFIDRVGWRRKCGYERKQNYRWSQVPAHQLWSPETFERMKDRKLNFPSELTFSNIYPADKVGGRGVGIDFIGRFVGEVYSVSDDDFRSGVHERSFSGRLERRVEEIKGGLLKWPGFLSRFKT